MGQEGLPEELCKLALWGAAVPRKACTAICLPALHRCSPLRQRSPVALQRRCCSLSRIAPCRWDTCLGIITLAAGQNKI